MKSVAKILFLKRARDRKSVPMASPFHTVITRSLKKSDLGNKSTNRHDIWHCDACWLSEPDRRLKFPALILMLSKSYWTLLTLALTVNSLNPNPLVSYPAPRMLWITIRFNQQHTSKSVSSCGSIWTSCNACFLHGPTRLSILNYISIGLWSSWLA